MVDVIKLQRGDRVESGTSRNVEDLLVEVTRGGYIRVELAQSVLDWLRKLEGFGADQIEKQTYNLAAEGLYDRVSAVIDILIQTGVDANYRAFPKGVLERGSTRYIFSTEELQQLATMYTAYQAIATELEPKVSPRTPMK